MNEPGRPEADEAAPPAPPSAGALLAQARGIAGLTVEDVASQLKLAPRQVVAIERDDFANLPGRTFVRGFVRNYARLVKLDVDDVLAALPGDGHAPAPERTLASAAGRSIGEMPRESRPRSGVARWAIPLLLAAIVGVAAFYEFARPPAAERGTATKAESALTAPPVAAPADPAPAMRPDEPATAPATGQATELPNPVAGTAAAPSPGAASAPALPVAQDAAGERSAAARSQLRFAFRGQSWIEVRDRSGSAVMSITGSAGSTRELEVAPPVDVVIGNAAVVDAAWRGRAVDLAPHTRQNVARIRLE
ncbi:MAG: DUF4115 domain-containing protein [Burkholderiales bacterium]|nr:DUF4115 domain-containing protein [Burkholderiales bacterium]